MPRVAARFLTVRTWESSISPAPYKHDREGSRTNHTSPREILKNILFWISHGSGFGSLYRFCKWFIRDVQQSQNYSNSPQLASHKENAILRCNFKIHTGN